MGSSVSAENDLRSSHQSSADADLPTSPQACIIGHSDLVIWFKRPAERLCRALQRNGVDRFLDEADLGQATESVVLLHAGAVLDAPLVQALIDSPGRVLLSNGPGDPVPIAAHAPAELAVAAAEALRQGAAATLPAGLQAVRVSELDVAYWKGLRKREEPYALTPGVADRQATEWRIFMGTYKGATDLVTKWAWPWPAFHVTRFCARWGVTPNQVTSASLVLVFAALYWFWIGEWTLGLLAAWVMTFLDTVDGKLARVTLNSSKFGNVFDHAIDLIHPPFWYVAWGIGVQSSGHPLSSGVLTGALVVIVAGYILQRVLEGISIWRLGLEIHVWRRIDTWFRLVTARRNPNLLLLTGFALVGRADLGLLAVAAWTAICLVLHLVQLAHAFVAAGSQGALRSWMEQTG